MKGGQMRQTASWGAWLIVLCAPPVVMAQEQQGGQAPPVPEINLKVPPPPPPVSRDFHTHDGFSVRAGIGPGVFSGRYRQGSGAGTGERLRTGGLDGNFQLWLGYAPAPALTLGLAGFASAQLSGSWEADGVRVAGGDLGSLLVGPFVDGYLSPQGGWHFGGTVGLGRLSFDIDDSPAALGFGGAVWGGRDFWVAPDWSMGTAVQGSWIRGTDSGADLTASRLSLTLLFSVSYQ